MSWRYQCFRQKNKICHSMQNHTTITYRKTYTKIQVVYRPIYTAIQYKTHESCILRLLYRDTYSFTQRSLVHEFFIFHRLVCLLCDLLNSESIHLIGQRLKESFNLYRGIEHVLSQNEYRTVFFIKDAEVDCSHCNICII